MLSHSCVLLDLPKNLKEHCKTEPSLNDYIGVSENEIPAKVE